MFKVITIGNLLVFNNEHLASTRPWKQRILIMETKGIVGIGYQVTTGENKAN
jgi:hypothetical protein